MSCLILAFILLLPPQPQGVDDLVDRVSEKYGNMKDLSAEFEQFQKDSSNQRSQTRGLVYLKSGKRARFETKGPQERLEVFDGKKYWNYTPSWNQATWVPMNKMADERMGVFQIVGNRESPWKEQFTEKHEQRDTPLTPGDRVVKLIPKNKDIRDVLVEVDPGTFLIHRFVFTYADGEINEFRLKNIKTDPLQDSLFIFKAPPDVDVIEQK